MQRSISYQRTFGNVDAAAVVNDTISAVRVSLALQYGLMEIKTKFMVSCHLQSTQSLMTDDFHLYLSNVEFDSTLSQ